MRETNLIAVDKFHIWDVKNMETQVSRLDRAYRKILISKIFTKGWGRPSDILTLHRLREQMRNRDLCYKSIPKDYPITIINRQIRRDCQIIEGTFLSPFYKLAPELVPPESRKAYFQMILPLEWKDEYRPICIHLAGTGDHFFWRRRNLMGKPLLKNGIGSLILESPFYGLRKPRGQLRSNLRYVSDIFVMGGCTIMEGIALLNWCESKGLGPCGVSGISMGGHMASLVASNWPKPLVVVPCLSWSTGSTVFTEGVMSESIDWDLLQNQFFSNDVFCKDLAKICKIVDPFILTLCDRDPTYSSYLERQRRNLLTTKILKRVNSILTRRQSKRGLSKLTGRFNVPLLLNKIERKNRNGEAVTFMRSLMDEYTHLKNFSVPFDTSLVIVICANSDGYVPRLGISRLEEIWPGITVRYVNSGHIGAYLWHRRLFHSSICEAFERAKLKLPPPSLPSSME